MAREKQRNATASIAFQPLNSLYHMFHGGSLEATRPLFDPLYDCTKENSDTARLALIYGCRTTHPKTTHPSCDQLTQIFWSTHPSYK